MNESIVELLIRNKEEIATNILPTETGEVLAFSDYLLDLGISLTVKEAESLLRSLRTAISENIALWSIHHNKKEE